MEPARSSGFGVEDKAPNFQQLLGHLKAELSNLQRLADDLSAKHHHELENAVALHSSADGSPFVDLDRLPNSSIRCDHSLPSQDVETVERPSSTLVATGLHCAAPQAKFGQPHVNRASTQGRSSRRGIDDAVNSCQGGVVPPDHPLRVLWDIILCGVMFSVVITEGARFAIDEWEDANNRTLDITIVVVFATDIFVNFNTAVERVVQGKSSLVYSRRAVAASYLKGWFLVDLLSSFPFEMLFGGLASAAPLLKLPKGVRLMRLLKAFRLLRLLKLAKMVRIAAKLADTIQDSFNLDQRDIHTFWKFSGMVLLRVSMYLLTSHFFACALLRLAASDLSLEFAWGGVEINEWSPVRRYCIGLCLAVDTLLTGNSFVGNSFTWPDSIAVTILRNLLNILFLLHLMLNISYFVHRTRSDPETDAIESRRSILRKFLRRHGVATYVREEVDEHMRGVVRGYGRVTDALFNDLSISLKNRVKSGIFYRMVERFKLFVHYPFNSMIDNSFELSTCEIIELSHFNLHDRIIDPEVQLQCMFYLIDGHVQMFGHNEDEIKSYPEGNYFGLEAIFAKRLGFPRYTLEAMARCEIWRLPRTAFDRILAHQSMAIQTCIELIRACTSATDDQGWVLVGQDTLKLATLQTDGLPSDFREKLSDMLRERRHMASLEIDDDEFIVKSEDLGVSLAYILYHFEDDVEEALGRRIDNISFRHLQNIFWGGDPETCPGFKSSQEKTCPRDKQQGCAIVDALESAHKGRATHYMSWCWDYSVAAVASSLRTWAKNNASRHQKVFVWICFFCNNQRSILLQKGGTGDVDLHAAFQRRLNSITERGGRMIAILDKYKGPVYIQRIWCIFETYQAVAMGLRVDMAMPQTVQHELKQDLRSGNVGQIAHDIAAIDCEHAVAWSKQDEESIKQEIRSTIGCERVNSKVRDSLRQSLSVVFESVLKGLEIPQYVAEVFKCIDRHDIGIINLEDIRIAISQGNGWLESYLCIKDHDLEGDAISAQLGLAAVRRESQSGPHHAPRMSIRSQASSFANQPQSAEHIRKEDWDVSDLHAYLKEIHHDPLLAFLRLKETIDGSATMEAIHSRIVSDLQEVEEGLATKREDIHRQLEITAGVTLSNDDEIIRDNECAAYAPQPVQPPAGFLPRLPGNTPQGTEVTTHYT